MKAQQWLRTLADDLDNANRIQTGELVVTQWTDAFTRELSRRFREIAAEIDELKSELCQIEEWTEERRDDW